MVTARPRRPFPQAPPKVPLSRPSASSLVSRVAPGRCGAVRCGGAALPPPFRGRGPSLPVRNGLAPPAGLEPRVWQIWPRRQPFESWKGLVPEHMSRSPTLRSLVGSVPDAVAEAPSPKRDRRLELPFTFEAAAA
jgi:hypothetical protein